MRNTVVVKQNMFTPAEQGESRCVIPGPTSAERRTFLELDGVGSGVRIYVNDELAGVETGAGFLNVKVSRFLKEGSNVVRLTGIVGEMRIVEKDPVYFERGGLYIKYLEKVNRVMISGEVRNDSAVAVAGRITLASPLFEDTVWECTLQPGVYHFARTIALNDHEKWDVDSPVLYDISAIAETALSSDTETVPFGVRSLRFEPDGFYLNGTRRELNGVVLRDMPDESLPARLRENGVDVIRLTGSPASQRFLSLCDQTGLLVMADIFDRIPADGERDAVISDIVKRDRIHPAIILWNMDPEKRTAEIVQYDSSRPFTAGLSGGNDLRSTGETALPPPAEIVVRTQ